MIDKVWNKYFLSIYLSGHLSGHTILIFQKTKH